MWEVDSMKSFEDVSKEGKVRRLKKIKTIIDVSEDYDYLLNYYMENGRNELLLYDVREILLYRWEELPDEVRYMLI